MPIKFNKELSTHLFKYINTIDVKFNPFDGRARSAQELLRQVQASRFKQANPRLKVGIGIHNKADAPKAQLAFIDGTETIFDTQKYKANEIMFQIHLKAMQLDAEYEMSGKSIEDV